jgi:hypothetical protein
MATGNLTLRREGANLGRCTRIARCPRLKRRTKVFESCTKRVGGVYEHIMYDTKDAGKGLGVSHVRPAILQSKVPLLRIYEASDLDEGIATGTQVSRRDLVVPTRARAVTSFDFRVSSRYRVFTTRTFHDSYVNDHGPVVDTGSDPSGTAGCYSAICFCSHSTAPLRAPASVDSGKHSDSGKEVRATCAGSSFHVLADLPICY